MKARATKWLAGIVAATAVSMVATTSNAATKPSAAAKKGGTITYAIDATVSGWCFSNALSGGPLGVTRMVYESLVDRDSKGNFIPQLAESWTPDAANQVWTFKLRSGIKFSNGEDFNADVVKLNMELGRGAVYSGKVGNYTFSNIAYGSTGVGVNANIVSIDAVDSTTVKITLDRPDSDFIALMYRAGRYVMRAPGQILTAAGTANTTGDKSCANWGIGTGPFKLVSFNPSEIVMARNELYWRKDAAGVQLPYLDGVTAIVVKEASQRAAAVRKGTVDAAYFVSGESTFIKDLSNRKSQVTTYKGNISSWGQWMPNQNKAGSPFKYLNCRLAAAFAVDWKLYNQVRLKGLGQYSGSIVGTGHTMFSRSGAPSYNLTKAKDYVTKCNADLGSAAPFKITLYADTSSVSLNNVKFVQGMMEKAGIQFNAIYQAESAVLIAGIYRGGGNIYDFAEGTPAEGPGSGYVIPFFVSKAFPTTSKSPIANTALGKGYNTVIAIGNHSDTTVDNLIYAAQAQTDPALKKKAWAEATAYIQSQGVAIPTVHTGAYTFLNNKSKLGGVGKFKNPDGKTYAPTADIKGFEWTGVWKG